MTRALVIGYGNPLRGDDGVGRAVAEALAGEGLAGARVLSVTQLTPELAETVAEADAVIFVDASADGTPGEVRVTSLSPAESADPLGHTGDPRCVLALAEAIHDRRPAAWLVAVPGKDFDFGTGLSADVAAAVPAAAAAVRFLVRQAPRPEGG